MGPSWSATKAYWSDPTPERQMAATAHLTLEEPGAVHRRRA
jgi:hypothetical protein